MLQGGAFFSLALQSEVLNQVGVAFLILSLQVLQVLSAIGHHLEESAS